LKPLTERYFARSLFPSYAGIAYSDVNGGLAIAISHGPGVPYYANNNTAPTISVRYAF
jgi:hypothetical protein